MPDNLPYMNAYGTITKVLEKIKSAATPPRFTQDFLATKLGLPGGSPKPVIPFLKRIGFLGSDGAPTELYKRFRNSSESGHAAAQGLKHGYATLYEMNEYAHDLNEPDLKGLVVQATGSEANSSVVKGIIGSFKALKDFASFDGEEEIVDEEEIVQEEPTREYRSSTTKLGLSYTINLNLPATSDIAVFDAIFKSLKENILRG